MVSGTPDSVVSVRDELCGDQHKDMDPISLSDYISDKIRFASLSKWRGEWKENVCVQHTF